MKELLQGWNYDVLRPLVPSGSLTYFSMPQLQVQVLISIIFKYPFHVLVIFFIHKLLLFRFSISFFDKLLLVSFPCNFGKYMLRTRQFRKQRKASMSQQIIFDIEYRVWYLLSQYFEYSLNPLTSGGSSESSAPNWFHSLWSSQRRGWCHHFWVLLLLLLVESGE